LSASRTIEGSAQTKKASNDAFGKRAAAMLGALCNAACLPLTAAEGVVFHI
jgi:hypothetical protein